MDDNWEVVPSTADLVEKLAYNVEQQQAEEAPTLRCRIARTLKRSADSREVRTSSLILRHFLLMGFTGLAMSFIVSSVARGCWTERLFHLRSVVLAQRYPAEFDPYYFLGVSSHAPWNEVNRSFRVKSLERHGCCGSQADWPWDWHEDWSQERMVTTRKYLKAWAVLNDEDCRNDYQQARCWADEFWMHPAVPIDGWALWCSEDARRCATSHVGYGTLSRYWKPPWERELEDRLGAVGGWRGHWDR